MYLFDTDRIPDGEMYPGIIHVVQEGERLYQIAQRYHVSVSELMYHNPYADLYRLKAGDEISVPAGMAK